MEINEEVKEMLLTRYAGRLKPKPVEIDDLQSQYRRIAHLKAQCVPVKEIAERVGWKPQTVYKALNNPIVKKHIEELMCIADQHTLYVREQLQAYAPKCVQVLQDVIENEEESAKTRAEVAIKYLNMAGHVAPKNVNVSGQMNHAILDASTINEIVQRAAVLQPKVICDE